MSFPPKENFLDETLPRFFLADFLAPLFIDVVALHTLLLPIIKRQWESHTDCTGIYTYAQTKNKQCWYSVLLQTYLKSQEWICTPSQVKKGISHFFLPVYHFPSVPSPSYYGLHWSWNSTSANKANHNSILTGMMPVSISCLTHLHQRMM